MGSPMVYLILKVTLKGQGKGHSDLKVFYLVYGGGGAKFWPNHKNRAKIKCLELPNW